MRNHLVAVVATLALLCAMSPVAASTTFPAQGAPGDGPFNDRCPAHQFLIGLAGHVGQWIDHVQIICSPILPDGTHGAKYYGPVRGASNGGTAIEMTCVPDSVVYAARIYLFESGKFSTTFFGLGAQTGDKMDSKVVTQVELSCGSMQADRQSSVAFHSGAPEGQSGSGLLQTCPSGELGFGFNGHFGKDVNALGLDCDVITRDNPPASAPVSAHTPYPIKITGRPKSTSGSAADSSTASTSLACPQGYVWRVASPTDLVCVTPLARRLAAAQNAATATHVSQTDHTYGPNTCEQGYVWREAYSGDVVCVTPPERDAAQNDNADAPAQIPKT